MASPTPSPRTPPATRVLYVNHEVEWGGAERSLIELIGALDRARVAPALVCPRPGPLADAARELDVPVHHVAIARRHPLAKLLSVWRSAQSVAAIARTGGTDIIHTNSLHAGYCGLRAGRLADVPVIWHVRDIGYPALGRWAARRATHCIANSRATARAIGGPRTTAIHNGVAARFFVTRAVRESARADLRARFGWHRDTPVAVMAGRLDPWKGHAVLIDAAARLAQREPDLHWIIVGGSPFDAGRARRRSRAAELEDLAAARGLADRVHLVGPQDDVVPWLAAADLLVHPSVQPEPFGRAVAEAQAVGIPVVAAAIGGLPEIVDHEVDGLLVPAADDAALADAVQRLVADRVLRRRMATAGRAKADELWTAARHAAAVEAVYEAVLGRAVPPVRRESRPRVPLTPVARS